MSDLTIAHLDALRLDDRDVWSVRDLMPHLGYDKWQNIDAAVGRAIQACHNSGFVTRDHFTGASKEAGSGPRARDWHVSRYGAYLLAMNGDPRKPEIALLQSYFAQQTRRAEVLLAPQTATAPEAGDVMLTLLESMAQQRREHLAVAQQVEAQRAEITVAATDAREAKAVADAALNAAVNTMPDHVLLSPTDIGDMLTPRLSGRRVNELLVAHGFQWERTQNKHRTATMKGKNLSKLIPVRDSETGQEWPVLRWYPAIVPVLARAIAVAS